MTLPVHDQRLQKRRSLDDYPTPLPLAKACVGVALDWLTAYKTVTRINVLDVGAGTGVWGKALAEDSRCANFFRPDFATGLRLEGVEINKRYRPAGVYTHWHKSNFLKWDLDGESERVSYDLIMGNPPFKLAREFVDHALPLLKGQGSILALLLRIGFYGSQERFKWWTAARLRHVAMLVPRPGFVTVIKPDGRRGSNDASEYGLFIWGRSDFASSKPELTTLSHLHWR